MKNRNKAYVFSIALLVSTLVFFVPIQPAKAQFVMAYDFSPNNNGNAIAYINAYVDSVYVDTMYNDPDSYPTATDANPLEVDVGGNISLKVGCWLNATYMNISSIDTGQLFIRHSVSVLFVNGSTVFSQQNFTYSSSTDAFAPMYFYDYWIVLGFVPEAGQYYTTTIIYEIYK